MSAYLSKFECLSIHISRLNTSSFINYFFSRLRDDIQRELYLHKPQSLHDSISNVKLIEDKCNVIRFHNTPQRFTVSWPSQLANGSELTQIGPWPLALSNSIPIKKLTPAEKVAHWERGLCFNYDVKFTRAHLCNFSQFLYLLTDDRDDELIDNGELDPPLPKEEPYLPNTVLESNTPCISFHALNGLLAHQLWRLLPRFMARMRWS